MSEQDLADRAARACSATVRALREAGVAPEALAEYVPEGRLLLVLRKGASMRPVGEVWRLGSLLLDTEGRLYAVGRATRAAERGRTGYQSVSREERRDLAAAALRGGYPEGTPVNFDAVPLWPAAPLAKSVATGADSPDRAFETLPTDAPIGVHDGAVRVRWRAGAALEGAPTLESYLAERAELLIHPPLGAD